MSSLRPQHPRLRGAPADLPFIFNVRTFQNTLNLTLLTDMGDLDLLGEAPGAESFEALWECSVVVELDGFSIHVASIDDLIAMKMAAGRPKDQNHVMELRALRELTASYNSGL